MYFDNFLLFLSDFTSGFLHGFDVIKVIKEKKKNEEDVIIDNIRKVEEAMNEREEILLEKLEEVTRDLEYYRKHRNKKKFTDCFKRKLMLENQYKNINSMKLNSEQSLLVLEDMKISKDYINTQVKVVSETKKTLGNTNLDKANDDLDKVEDDIRDIFEAQETISRPINVHIIDDDDIDDAFNDIKIEPEIEKIEETKIPNNEIKGNLKKNEKEKEKKKEINKEIEKKKKVTEYKN